MEGKGELSDTIAYEFVERLNRLGKPGIVGYMSDFDPKGTDMPVSMARKIEKFRREGKLEHDAFLFPIAVKKEQIDKYGLPRKVIPQSKETGRGAKAYETLIDRWEKRMGKGRCELVALEAKPGLYEKIVRDALTAWRPRDSEIRDEVNKVKSKAREKIKKSVEDALVDRQDALEKLFDEQRELLKKLEEVLPDKEELDEKFGEAKKLLDDKPEQDILRSTKDDLAHPEIELPEILMDAPSPVLLDTRRSYEDQLDIYRKWKDNGTLEE